MKIPRTKDKSKLLKWARAKLDTLFSLWVRGRDAGDICIDLCGTWDVVTQAGHFRERGMMSTRWHPQNVNLQNRSCNYWRSNKNDIYMHGKGIDKKYGEGKAERLCKLSKQIKQWDFKDLVFLIRTLEETPQDYESFYQQLVGEENY